MTDLGSIEVYKIYCSQTILVYGYINLESKEYKEFVIDAFDSQYTDLINHLETVKLHIGFNHLKYDYQIIDCFIQGLEMYRSLSPSFQLRNINTRIFHMQSENDYIGEQDFFIPQLDLSKLLGLNTAIRTTTLNDLCNNLGTPMSDKIKDLFFHTDKMPRKITKQDVSKYLKSCVFAIADLYNIVIGNTSYERYSGHNLIDARNDISKYFKTRLTLNMSNVKAGEVLLCRLYCKANNITLRDFPPAPPAANELLVSKIIPEFAVFNNKSLNNYKDYLNNLKIKPTDNINFNILLNNIKIKFGNGGIHGSADSGIYQSDKDAIIISNDITSFYASVICYMRYFPSHLNESFVDIYQRILNSRFSAIDVLPKGHPIISSLKEFLVGIYGKFNEQASNLYNPELRLKTIITSQMFMCLWLDKMLSLDIEFLAINTDGMIYRVKRVEEEKVNQILKELTDSYGFHVKTDYVNTLFLKDVNNYAYISRDNKVCKVGAFDNEFNIYKTYKNREVGEILNDFFINNNKDRAYLNKKYNQDALNVTANYIYPIQESQLSLF